MRMDDPSGDGAHVLARPGSHESIEAAGMRIRTGTESRWWWKPNWMRSCRGQTPGVVDEPGAKAGMSIVTGDVLISQYEMVKVVW